MTRPAFLPERLADLCQAGRLYETACTTLYELACAYKGPSETFPLQLLQRNITPPLEAMHVIAREGAAINVKAVVRSLERPPAAKRPGYGNRLFRAFLAQQAAKAMQDRFHELLKYAQAGDLDELKLYYIAMKQTEKFIVESSLLTEEHKLHNPKYLAKLQTMRKYTFRQRALQDTTTNLHEENSRRLASGLPPLSDTPIDNLAPGERLTRHNSHKLTPTPKPSEADIAAARAAHQRRLSREAKREINLNPQPPTPQFRQLISDAKEALAAEDLAKRIAQSKLSPQHSTSSTSSPEQLAALEAARTQFDPLPKPPPPLSALFPPNPTPPNPNQSLPPPNQSEEV